MHDRGRQRERLTHAVVIRDDQLDSKLATTLCLSDRSNPAVNAHKHLPTSLSKLLNGFTAQPVTIFQPIRHEILDICS
jgi:hypothetical protein